MKRKRAIIYSLLSAFLLAGFCFGLLKLSPSFLTASQPAGKASGETPVGLLVDQFIAETSYWLSETASSTASQLKEKRYLADLTVLREKFRDNQLSFLEVDLAEMQVVFYQKGRKEKTFPILARGEPEGWGGTPAGLYKIMAGNQESYSIATEVYMPWALKFYGKYYLHGEPYLWPGRKLETEHTGGCLRLRDDDAKELYQLTELNMPVLVLDEKNDDYQYQAEPREFFPKLTAQSYLAADLKNGFIFASKEPAVQRPIASLTKLMTALVTVEQIDLKKQVRVTAEALELGYGEDEAIEEGQAYHLVELLYPMLMQSSNDAAEVLALFLGRNRAVRLMNEKAKSLLMTNSQFVCPSGYSPENISTAQDLYYLARYIFYNRPPLLKISRGERVPAFGPLSFNLEEIWNKNIFVHDETFLGGKTGFIEQSGYNGLFLFQFKDEEGRERPVVIIVLGSGSLAARKSDVQKTYIWLKKNYFPGT